MEVSVAVAADFLGGHCLRPAVAAVAVAAVPNPVAVVPKPVAAVAVAMASEPRDRLPLPTRNWLPARPPRSHLVCLRNDSAAQNKLDDTILSSKAMQDPVGEQGNTKAYQQSFCTTLVLASSTSALPYLRREFHYMARRAPDSPSRYNNAAAPG